MRSYQNTVPLDHSVAMVSNSPMWLAWFVIAYLVGSISAAILVCRALGHPDPRTSGSGNPGATNVLRQSGKLAAFLTLLGDVAKGYVPVAIGMATGLDAVAVAALGAGAFTGHLFPVYFSFRGGKGVATLIGVLFGFSLLLGLAFVATWLVVAAVARYSSLSALTAATLAPIYAWRLHLDMVIIATTVVMVIILLWRHRSNIKNLLNGTESKIGKKSQR